MIFSTPLFVLVFLPLTLGGYYLLAARRGPRLALLLVASLVFYGWWDVRLVPLLVGSVLVNGFVADRYRRGRRRAWLTAGVVFDLGLLGFFKYTDFLVSSLLSVAGYRHQPLGIVLPLGISFFTFQQISYLVDVRRSDGPFYSLRDYFLYVTYFPQLIAGPIVRHDEIIDQFDLPPRRAETWENLSRGAVLFVIGLVKKVVFADRLALVANPLFAHAMGGHALGAGEAWIASGAFMLQLYFDFAGYSDMAIGMGRMCGFRLPLNFDAPYRATSIGDFWRRWHLTLGRFLRDYLYIPLGGSRHGPLRRIAAAMLTMLLGGLWHGAGWAYAAWGSYHGLGLVVHTAWRRLGGPAMPRLLGWAVTQVFVLTSVVIFRTAAFAPTWSILGSMAGLHVGGGVAAGDLELVLVATAVAVIGPTSQEIALGRLAPRWWVAAATAAATVYAFLLMCEGAHPEFIYFQF